jgi:predicted secreted protein
MTYVGIWPALAALAFLSAITAGSAQAEMTVCSDGCSYSTVQAALDSAGPDDKVDVCQASIEESLHLKKRVILHGCRIGEGRPLLDGNEGGSITFLAEGIVLRGFYLNLAKGTLNLSSSSNMIYLNDISDSRVIETIGHNFWNSSSDVNYQYNSRIFKGRLGNYWHAYRGKDKDHNGIGDEPMVINSDNMDYYPLMQPADYYRASDEEEPMEGKVNAQLSKNFTISLKSNPTTGYMWSVDYDSHFLRLDDQSYQRARSSAIGGGGEDIFRFTPIREGETLVSFIYKRPWENIASGTREFVVKISA